MNESTGLKIMQQCPRFERCDVPICPLDPNQDQRTSLVGEKRCPLAKSYRVRIGKSAGLPRKGLTRKEYAAKERWDQLDESEKLRRTSYLRPFGRFIRVSQKEFNK